MLTGAEQGILCSSNQTHAWNLCIVPTSMKVCSTGLCCIPSIPNRMIAFIPSLHNFTELHHALMSDKPDSLACNTIFAFHAQQHI